MLFKTNGEELRRALKEIEIAEKNGFMFCEAVFTVQQENEYWEVGTYSDLLEKAYPTGGHLNWGRGQNVTKENTFKDGKVIPIKERGIRMRFNRKGMKAKYLLAIVLVVWIGLMIAAFYS